ncbi:MAG: hypothetical protein HYW47_01320 [Deltaproteobacteria bacterium]|nr:hypothetical protein [Deltaproteobacteria bacterium]
MKCDLRADTILAMRKGIIFVFLIFFTFVSCQKKPISPPPPIAQEKVEEVAQLLEPEIPPLEVPKKNLREFKNKPLYVEVSEINTDDISEIIVSPDRKPTTPLFHVEKEVLVLNQKTFEEFEKKGLLNAQLIVSYEILYEGKMREISQREYFIFTSFPSIITFHNKFTDKLELSPREALQKLFDQRILPEKIVFSQNEAGALTIEVGTVKTTFYNANQKTIFKAEKQAELVHKVLAPLPLEVKINPEDIKLVSKSLGLKTFTTKINILNRGVLKQVEIEE